MRPVAISTDGILFQDWKQPPNAKEAAAVYNEDWITIT
jgi:hypothetical protein